MLCVKVFQILEGGVCVEERTGYKVLRDKIDGKDEKGHVEYT